MIVEVLLKRLFQVVVDATKSDFELRPDEMPGGKDRNSVDFGDTSNDNIPTNRRLSKSLGRAPSNRSLGSIKLPGSVPESIRFLHNHFSKTIDGPYTFDQLRTLDQLKTLIERLRVIDESYLIFALLWCKLQFFVTAQGDERSTDYSRGWACEIAAMRLLRKYEGKELLHVLTTDFRAFTGQEEPTRAVTTLLGSRGIWTVDTESEAETEALLPRNQRIGANSFTALEVAIIAEAKHFTSSHIVQDVLWEIWNGDIIYWRDVTSDTCKQATYYDAQEGGFWNFARLRVPRYCFFIESLNFAVLLPLYLVVVCNRQYESLGWVEIVLAVWFGGFAYQEWDQFRESGQLAFYTADPWNFFDLGMIAIYISWLLLRIVGIAKGNVEVIGYSYDILAMLALFLVPRIFRFLSLTPYFGILLPCLRRMGTDFVKFMVLVLTVTVGFMITFCIIGRDSFTVDQMAWMLVKIFFGSSYVGFDNMKQIHPILGPPLMLVFITFTNILLVTALISVLSNTFAKVMSNAREEYLFLFATTCLQSVKSDHMVILNPPFNLLGLLVVRPLRLFLPSNHPFLRRAKIAILKATHAPYVFALSVYEQLYLGSRYPENRRASLLRTKPGTRIGYLGSFKGRGAAALRMGIGLGHISGSSASDHGNDTDEEEGLDTGRMLDIGLQMKTKEQIDAMAKEIAELKQLLLKSLEQK